jgi:hypothetical protein
VCIEAAPGLCRIYCGGGSYRSQESLSPVATCNVGVSRADETDETEQNFEGHWLGAAACRCSRGAATDAYPNSARARRQ